MSTRERRMLLTFGGPCCVFQEGDSSINEPPKMRETICDRESKFDFNEWSEMMISRMRKENLTTVRKYML